MTPTRIGIASFAVGIVVSVVTRMWATTALPHGEFVFSYCWLEVNRDIRHPEVTNISKQLQPTVSGGLVFAGLAWLFGAYYGYRAIRDGGR